VIEVNGVGLDPQGDLVLDSTKVESNLMWIANTDDLGRGTLSKIDTRNRKEVARYYSVTCYSKGLGAGCVDVNGNAISAAYEHQPSRTAVDLNFDVWVANRALSGGQPSATKIANSTADCIDRNNNGKIDTSADHNGDGRITTDCDSNGQADDVNTICSGSLAGKPPEFLGPDDECILHTANFANVGDVGRSVCLARGVDPSASDAWVGTNAKSVNAFYRIDGKSGKVDGPYTVASPHKIYGCVVDGSGFLWSVDAELGSLTYLDTKTPSQVGPLLVPPFPMVLFYGIAIDSNSDIWLGGGWGAKRVYRYRPNRTSFGTLGQGTWAGVSYPSQLTESRGIAADNRGKIWVAINNGYILRVDQNVPDGLTDKTSTSDFWPVSGKEITGAGVDFDGHIWGISFDNSVASRLDVDAQGNPTQPTTGLSNTVLVGVHPYTYSDFTGYGLKVLTNPQGHYVFQMSCGNQQDAEWESLSWNATTPAGTAIEVRVRTGDKTGSTGAWFGPYSASPVSLATIASNPALFMQIEFTLKTQTNGLTPILHDFTAKYSCVPAPD
jgi:hypothetical protein